MKKITLTPINMETELDEIISWDSEFAGTPEYASVEHFIFEDWLIHGMAELIQTNYENVPIGEDERKLILVAKNKTGKIVGFTIQSIYSLLTNDPELFLQYIIINPKYQNQGIGTEILNNLSNAIKTAIGKKPKSMFSYIEKENFASQKLYKKFGLDFEPVKNDERYLKAVGVMPEFQPGLE